MDRVFSVDEISDHFWPPPPPAHPPAPVEDLKLSRSASEWAFQMFLQEEAAAAASPLSSDTATSSSKSVGENDVVEIKDGSVHRKNLRSKRDVNRKTGGAPPPHGIHSNPAPAAAAKPFNTGLNVPVGSEGYQEFLQSRLNLACAAVALTKAPYVIGQSSAGVAETVSVGSADSISATQASETASHCKDTGGPAVNPSLPVVPKKIVAQAKPTISGSSREQSYDDEAEDENETTGNMVGTDVKRVRRMLSNRESARRSRRRKQAHLTEIETQVSQLKVENSSLLKRLTNISQKYNEAAVDNRVLKADVETLRAKVQMAEETVKRVTGMTPLLQAISEISTMRAPAFSGSPSDSADSTVPVHNPTQQLYQPPPPRVETAGVLEIASTRNTLPNPAASMTGANKTGRTPSMQRVASLEHLQKRLCGGINQSTSKCSPDP